MAKLLDSSNLISGAELERFRKLLSKFRNGSSPVNECFSLLEEISGNECIEMFFVGGFLRDVWLGRVPRDLDIVYRASDKRRFQRAAKQYGFSENTNTFGLPKLSIFGVDVDAWPLESTLNFRNGSVSPVSISSFPKTTFFTVEGVAFEAYAPKDEKIGYESGFFNACSKRTLHIQNPITPLPKYQVMRAIEFKRKLGWDFSDDLDQFISKHKISDNEYRDLRKAHYGY